MKIPTPPDNASILYRGPMCSDKTGNMVMEIERLRRKGDQCFIIFKPWFENKPETKKHAEIFKSRTFPQEYVSIPIPVNHPEEIITISKSIAQKRARIDRIFIGESQFWTNAAALCSALEEIKKEAPLSIEGLNLVWDGTPFQTPLEIIRRKIVDIDVTLTARCSIPRCTWHHATHSYKQFTNRHTNGPIVELEKNKYLPMCFFHFNHYYNECNIFEEKVLQETPNPELIYQEDIF
ncbi:MAG: hypothetical protein G01um101418_801 [Parcubacteria group bacterium Gr01-1014_18]|nr:MAG: hypothetical protein Greene041636_683 [Parcubacteria group bacterium Greene0416_36]TSC80103.1 MAG: hypothetical protein G01um101418_801 [Parcubacteria group bacterium Gr01-1014_18]TSC98607.1 MAG: hypothetical protein Greene101420_659 [Parcubacteria group bacterium Greene1014_20]TSD06434.1 MAG: hypothetical protein Greene07142_925 [Parcubacteria group bacterium Greene0714_2]